MHIKVSTTSYLKIAILWFNTSFKWINTIIACWHYWTICKVIHICWILLHTVIIWSISCIRSNNNLRNIYCTWESYCYCCLCLTCICKIYSWTILMITHRSSGILCFCIWTICTWCCYYSIVRILACAKTYFWWSINSYFKWIAIFKCNTMIRTIIFVCILSSNLYCKSVIRNILLTICISSYDWTITQIINSFTSFCFYCFICCAYSSGWKRKTCWNCKRYSHNHSHHCWHMLTQFTCFYMMHKNLPQLYNFNVILYATFRINIYLCESVISYHKILYCVY